MAVNKERPAPGPGPAGVPLSREQRWVRYGSNVAVAIVLAAVLTVAIVWLSVAFIGERWQSDWTASGRYSLSERTQRALETLDTAVSLDFVYPDPDESVYPTPELLRVDELEYDRLKELIDRYAASSDRVTVRVVDPFDPDEAKAYLSDLQQAFSEDFRRTEDLVQKFQTFRDELDAFINQEIASMQGFTEIEPTPPRGLFVNLQAAATELSQLSQEAEEARRRVMEQLLGVTEKEATLDRARSLTTTVIGLFDQFVEFYEGLLTRGEAGELDGPLPEPVNTFLRTAAERYGPLRDRAKALKAELEEQTEDKFDDIKQRFEHQAKFLLIRGPEEVQVLGPEDVWRQRPNPVEGDAGYFGGERAVTAAVLAVSKPTKPAVLFVTHGAPATGWGGPYSRMAERLRDENFIVEDWDVLSASEMPTPEKASESVLVLVPPAPQNPQRPTPPPQPQAYEPALDAIEAGTPAVVLAEHAGFMTPQVPYSDLFEDLGLDAKTEAVAVRWQVVDAAGTEAAAPQIEVKDYTSAPVTRSLGALPSVFLEAVPVMPEEDLPEGVHVEPLVLLPAGPDYWAETAPMSLRTRSAQRDPEEDIVPVEPGMAFTPRTVVLQVLTRVVGAILGIVAVGGFVLWSGGTGRSWRVTTIVCAVAALALIVVPFFLPGEMRQGNPVPLAVAVTRSVGDAEQRIVVFGDSNFAMDDVAFYSYRYAVGGGATRDIIAYPGNAELFVNAALWTLGQDELLAVSTDAMDARRTGEVPQPLLVQIGGIVLGPVVLVTVIGIVVLVVRRR